MDSVPGDIAGVTDLAVVLVHLLEIHKDTTVFLGQFAADGNVFIHSAAHHIAAVGFDDIGGEDENTLDVILDFADHGFHVTLIFIGQNVIIRDGGGIELPPDIVDADTDGHPVGV